MVFFVFTQILESLFRIRHNFRAHRTHVTVRHCTHIHTISWLLLSEPRAPVQSDFGTKTLQEFLSSPVNHTCRLSSSPLSSSSKGYIARSNTNNEFIHVYLHIEINFHPISWPHKRKYYTQHSLLISQSQITFQSMFH